MVDFTFFTFYLLFLTCEALAAGEVTVLMTGSRIVRIVTTDSFLHIAVYFVQDLIIVCNNNNWLHMRSRCFSVTCKYYTSGSGIRGLMRGIVASSQPSPRVTRSY